MIYSRSLNKTRDVVEGLGVVAESNKMSDTQLSHNKYGVPDEFLDEIAQYFPQGTSVEEMLEVYNDPELWGRYMQQLQDYYAEAQKDYSVYQECAVPVLTQSVHQMWQLLFFCLLLRFLCRTGVPRSVVHIGSVVFGLLSLWKFYEWDMVYTLLPVFLFVPFFYLRTMRRGLFLCGLTTVYLVACEFYVLDAVKWNKIKGSVMIIMMKLISVVFDMENGLTHVPSGLLELFGYLFNPASVIFGPFITYKDYMMLFHGYYSLSLAWAWGCVRSVVLCAVCLVWSSCGPSNYLRSLSTYAPFLDDNKWWQAYQDAQAFRFSHYFVSYFSESACLISGITTETSIGEKERDDDENKECPRETSMTPNWTYPVANLKPVELPGSLVDVVTNWNLPMHYWLKTYIYKTTRGRGMFVAVLATYIASSILHGMNVQLSAVLLTIGIFAYIEGFIRHVLASIFSACIEARVCRNCTHVYKRGSFWVAVVNLAFAFLAVWNLAYLGCMFDNSPEEEAGYSWRHIHRKWTSFSYVNHAVMLGGFFVLRLISTGRVV